MIFNNTKITSLIYSPYECTAVEEYLENMAENGWLLAGIKGPFFKFKKIQPQKIKYSVDVIGKTSSFDSKKADELLEYREYCNAAGWIFICQANEIQVFYSKENTEIVSIHTDESEKFKLVFNSSLRGKLGELFITLMLIFNVNLQLSRGSTEFVLSSNFMIFTIFVTLIIIFFNVIKLINFSAWAIRAKWKLKEDKFMPYNNYKILKRKNILLNTFSLLSLSAILLFSILDNSKEENLTLPIFITVIAFTIFNFFIKDFVNKKGYSRNTRITINIASIFVFAFLLLSLTTRIIFPSINNDKKYTPAYCDLNLTVNDFTSNVTTAESPYTDCSKSILAAKIHYSCGSKDNYLTYTLLQSKYPLVIKFQKNRLLNMLDSYGYNLAKINTNLPRNITVYSSSKNKFFILVSDDRVVDIKKTFNDISDDDFLNTVYLKLFTKYR